MGENLGGGRGKISEVKSRSHQPESLGVLALTLRDAQVGPRYGMYLLSAGLGAFWSAAKRGPRNKSGKSVACSAAAIFTTSQSLISGDPFGSLELESGQSYELGRITIPDRPWWTLTVSSSRVPYPFTFGYTAGLILFLNFLLSLPIYHLLRLPCLKKETWKKIRPKLIEYVYITRL